VTVEIPVGRRFKRRSARNWKNWDTSPFPNIDRIQLFNTAASKYPAYL
jgi:hypothetical protein